MVGTNKYGALGDSFSACRILVERNLERSVVDIAVGPHYTCAVCSGFYSTLQNNDNKFFRWIRVELGQGDSGSVGSKS